MANPGTARARVVWSVPTKTKKSCGIHGCEIKIQSMWSKWSKWSQGLRIVQLMKIRNKLFGCQTKIGLNTSNLPIKVLEYNETEEDLTAITESETNVELENLISKTKSISDNALKLRQKTKTNLEHQADKIVYR